MAGADRIGEAFFELRAVDRRLNADLRRAEGATLRTSRRMERAFRRVQRVTRGIGRTFTSFAGVAGVGGLAFALTRAVKASADFDRELTKVTALVGVGREDVRGMRDDLLRLAAETGRAPQELAEGLFFVTSAGARGKKAFDILTASAKASAIGLGETKVVADAATSATNAYAGANLSGADAVGILVAAVREGKLEASSLSSVLGRVIPIASELDVSFNEVAAAIAAMSRLGADAFQASTGLRNILASLLNPASQSAEALASIGLSAEDLRAQLREEGLLSVLETLREELQGNEEALGDVFPNIRSLTAFLNLMGKNAAVTRDIFMALAAAGARDLSRSFEQSESSGLKLEKALAAINVAMIGLGDEILPVVLPQIEDLTEFLSDPDTVRGIKNIVTAIGDFARGLRELHRQTSAIGAGGREINIFLAPLRAIEAAGELVRVQARLEQAERDLAAAQQAVLRRREEARAGMLPAPGSIGFLREFPGAQPEAVVEPPTAAPERPPRRPRRPIGPTAEELRRQDRLFELTQQQIEAEARLAEQGGDRERALRLRVDAIVRARDREIQKARELFKDEEQFAAARQALGVQATADIVAANEQLLEDTEDTFSAMEEAVTLFQRTLSDAFAQMVLDGELNFRALGEAFIREFVQRVIESGVSDLFKAIQGVDAGDVVGALGFLKGFIPGLQAGGIVTRPTLAALAEGGVPEAVIPLSRLGKLGGAPQVAVQIFTTEDPVVRDGTGAGGVPLKKILLGALGPELEQMAIRSARTVLRSEFVGIAPRAIER